MRILSIIFFGLFLIACEANPDSESVKEESELLEVETAEEYVISASDKTSPYGEEHELHWDYEDDFSDEEKEKLITWVNDVMVSVTNTIGQYPFDIYFNFIRSTRGGPVTFGRTRRRKNRQGVELYVNPDYSLEDFMADWTAPHEIAHLSQPFVGRDYKWFSEGYATYLSRQIMIDMGYFTEESFDSMYLARIHDTREVYDSPSTFAEVSDSLKKNGNWGTFYWGGAGFYYSYDQHLNEHHDMRFRDLVREYLQCCRLEDETIMDVIHSYDELCGEDCCSSLYDKYVSGPSKRVMENF